MGESRKEQDRPCAPCPDCGAEMYEKFWGNGGWARTDKATGRMHSVSDCIRRMKRQLDEARAQCSAWIRNSNDKAAEANTLATDLDAARALVSKLAGVIQPCIVCCFAMARFGRYDAAFGVGAPMLCDQCAAHSLEDGEDWRACPPESFHVALRALAKENGK